MYFTFSLLPATLFAVLGYVVLYCAIRSEDGMRTAGIVLGMWVLLVALLFLLAGTYFSVTDSVPLETHFREMHDSR